MYFRKNLLQKTWLDKCLKSLVSDDPSTGSNDKWVKTLLQSEQQNHYKIF